MTSSDPLVLLIGASGYIGGRLRARLETEPVRLRCLARRPEFVRPATASTEVVQGDCLDPESLAPALQGVDTAYYLVHSMGAGNDFAARDRAAAANFAQAAGAAGVRRIVYLGGLGRDNDQLSAHLRSRQETGEVLRSGGVPVVELRSSIVLGSGSLSFELIRSLVQRLPVMLCPRWVRTPTQPIAVEDLVEYLVAARTLAEASDQVYEVGGADVVSYREIMLEYARQRGLRRWLLPVPLLTPRLSSLWLGLTTPVYARVGRELIESVRNPTVVDDRSAASAFDVRPMGLAEAIHRARLNEDQELAATRWSDAISSGRTTRTWAGVQFGTRLVDSRSVEVDAPAAGAFAPIRRIGGAQGWYHLDSLWTLRGWADLLLGGIGMRRGRRDPESLRVGDTLDCWRVEAFEPDRRLRLAAEMKLPGRAWLEFEVEPGGKNQSVVRQTAIFDPKGLAGLLYWYGIYPLHGRIFTGMLRAIATRAERADADQAVCHQSESTPA